MWLMRTEYRFVLAGERLLDALASFSTVGSMPGAHALDALVRHYQDGGRVLVIFADSFLAGAVALCPHGSAYRTVTYVRSGFHNSTISQAIKESARRACLEEGERFVVPVLADNLAAQQSMDRVWSEHEIEVDGDTWLYSTSLPVSGEIEELYRYFLDTLRSLRLTSQQPPDTVIE